MSSTLDQYRQAILVEVAAFIRAQVALPKWSPSNDGEIEHFAGHLAEDVENDLMEESAAFWERILKADK